MSGKEIWLPKTETRATVDEAGNVRVWDEILMELQPIKTKAGYGPFDKEDLSKRIGGIPRPRPPRKSK
jgi:hypothetical protein